MIFEFQGIELPDFIFDLKLSSAEFHLYCIYKRIAGNRGNCCQTTKVLAQQMGVSKNTLNAVKKKLCAPREELGGMSLITIQHRFEPNTKGRLTDLITINDVRTPNPQKT